MDKTHIGTWCKFDKSNPDMKLGRFQVIVDMSKLKSVHKKRQTDVQLDCQAENNRAPYKLRITWADPVSLVEGPQSLDLFFCFCHRILHWRGEGSLYQYFEQDTIGLPAKRHFNGVSLPGRCWHDFPGRVSILWPTPLWIRACIRSHFLGMDKTLFMKSSPKLVENILLIQR